MQKEKEVNLQKAVGRYQYPVRHARRSRSLLTERCSLECLQGLLLTTMLSLLPRRPLRLARQLPRGRGQVTLFAAHRGL